MAHTKHPRLLYLALDARDAEAAGAALISSGCDVTTCATAAHARRMLRDGSDFDLIALDPRTPGSVDLVARLASRALTVNAASGVFVRVDRGVEAVPAALRDRGIVGVGTLDDLVALAAGAREVLATSGATVRLTTVLRIAWMARASVAVHVALDRVADAAHELVVWVHEGEPVDARWGELSGLDALLPLVPGSISYGKPGRRPVAITVEHETSPAEVTVSCPMVALLDLIDEDGPVTEVLEEEAAELDGAWSIPPAAAATPTDVSELGENAEAVELVTHAGSIDGLLSASVLDVTGKVEATLGAQRGRNADALELWTAIAQFLSSASPDDMVEGVVITSENAVEILRPVAARIFEASFARDTTNPALAWWEVERLCATHPLG